MSRDKRQFERKKKTIDFYCYIDGQRFDSESMDISAGGAFLRTFDPLGVGQPVILIPKREREKRLAVVLVGRIMRAQETPFPGVGIRWERCVSKEGLHNIYDFVADYLEVRPSSLPVPGHNVVRSEIVGYDFVQNLFYVPKLSGTAIPVAPDATNEMEEGTSDLEATSDISLDDDEGAPMIGGDYIEASHQDQFLALSESTSSHLLEPDDFSKSEEDGVVTEMLGALGGRLAVRIPVRFAADRLEGEGTVRAIGLRTVFLETTVAEIGEAASILVEFVIPVKPETVIVTLVCDTMSWDPSGRLGYPGAELNIKSVKGEPDPGLFERYVKFLYFDSQT
jgi:hypothetical protein